MKIAVLTTDNRQPFRQYERTEPFFGTAPEALLQGFAMLPEVEVHVVSCIRQAVASPQKLAPNIFFHSLVVPKIGWIRTLYQGCIRATRKKIAEIKPDIVHGQGTELDCAISAIFSGFPNVVTIHGNMRLIAKLNNERPLSFNWLAAKLERFTLPRTDGVVCITRYTQQAVADLAKRTWLLPNAVDKAFFDVVPKSPPVPIGLCVGTICYRKNQNAFIRSLDSLAKTNTFKLVFLGQVENDSYGQEFLQLVKDRRWCEYVGWADRGVLRNYFETAAFLALPTLEDNCPMVVLEAMAAGVPVLASSVGGIPDLIRDNVTGVLCDPAQPETFKIGVERFLKDRAFRERMTTNAKTEAVERFHPITIARKHVEIYEDVLHR